VKVEELREPVNCFDPILAEELLKGMQGYEIFTIKEVYSAIPRAVEFELPYLPEFLDKRLKKNKIYESKMWKMNFFNKNE